MKSRFYTAQEVAEMLGVHQSTAYKIIKRLPKNFGFMVAHPCATVAPTKLESYKTHQDPPGISGSLVEGRIVYDAFVLDNKKNAIYYQEITSAE